MTFVDSNVFVIALRYPADRNARANTAFLSRLAARGDGVTSVVNLIEVCGILSFNLNERQLRGLYRHFARRFGVRVVPEDPEGRAVMPATPSELLMLMASRMSFGDALVASAVARWAPAARAFVSWDAKHFAGKLPARVVTPSQFLERAAG
jgi:predicted nucleic acid-binding protein